MNPMATPVKTALLATLFAASVHGLPAQDDPCLSRTVAVNVIGNEDEAVKGLEASRFRGKYHGRNVEIVSAKYDTGPRRILLILDTSSATTADPAKWKSELVMVEGLVSWTPAQSLVALWTFARPGGEKIDFNLSHDDVKASLAQLETAPAPTGPPTPTTPLDAVNQGLAALDPARPGDVICVITDGGDKPGQARKDEVEQALLAKGVRLFGFLPQSALPDRRASPESSPDAAMLRNLIEASGGDYLVFSSTPTKTAASDLTPQDRDKLLVASRSFAQEMNDLYLLQIKLPEPVGQTREWTLVAGSNGKDSNPRVVYPRRLAKCP